MTLNLRLTQVQERLTVALDCAAFASLPSAIIVVDGKAYAGLWIPNTFTYDIALERGPHIIYGQATDSAGTVTTSPITYVMAYELTAYGIDVYSGDAKLDAFGITLHDALLPDLPTLNFSCATLLSGAIGAVIRERGLRQYQFAIATVGASNGLYQYACKAAESYALTTAIMTLQTAYGATSDAIKLLVPSLNIVNAQLLAQMTYPQLLGKITPLEVIKQLMIQAFAQASVRSGNLYAFPLDIGGKKVTFSADIKSAVVGNVAFYAIGKYEINTGIVYAVTTAYQHFTMTGFFTYNPKGYNGDVCSLRFDSGYGSGVIPTVRNVEINVDGAPVFIDATEFGGLSESCSKDITAIAQQNMIPLGYRDPDYHMQRLDPLTGWQRDADVYDSVIAHYVVKQFPNPNTVLTLNDKVNWKDANGANALVSDVTQVTDTLLPVPSGALGMLKSVGNATRAGLSTLFKYFDRIQFNWNPVTATTVTVSLQQDASNKLELTHTFAGQTGAGFVQHGSPGVSTDTVTESISLDDTGSGGTATKFVTKVMGTTTANCSYRVMLLNAGGGTIWQDAWRSTIGDTFETDVPSNISQTYQATTVRIEFTNLYLIAGNYGVQCVQCNIQVQTYGVVGSHQMAFSSTSYALAYAWFYDAYYSQIVIPSPPTDQWWTYIFYPVTYAYYLDGVYTEERYTPYFGDTDLDPRLGGNLHPTFKNLSFDAGLLTGTILVILNKTVIDYAWVSAPFSWSAAFNLFETVDIPFSSMTRTGNPVTLQTIAPTFSGDNYVDTLCLVADNPLPVTVRAGTGSRAYTVTDDFGSEAGAQAYADGLLPIVSVAREQYTRDVSLETDLDVGSIIDGDGVNYTIYSVDYRQDGKTLAAGKSMDTLMARLREQSRRLDSLERKA